MSDADKTKEAKAAYGQAKDKYAAGDYAGALPLYQKADDLVPGAVPKYKVAECYDKMKKTGEAVKAYQAFLDSGPEPDKHQERINNAKKRLEALKATPAKVAVAITPADAQNVEITVDGAPHAGGPELTLPPGKHTVVVSAEGYEPTTSEFEVAFGEETQINVALTASEQSAAPVPVAPPPVEPPKEERSLVPAYVTLGLAGAGAVVGTIFGIQALGSQSDFDDNPTQESFDDTERNALIADMSFGIALTFGVTGVVLLVTGGEDNTTGSNTPSKAKTKTSFTPFVGPLGGGAAATIEF